MNVGRQLSRSIRSGFFVALGILLSLSINALVLAPSIAQTTTPSQIPNNASIQYSAPNPAGGPPVRVDQPSNTVNYPLSAVAGVNNLGLGIVKSANKSAAEPGDVVVYTLLVSNSGAQPANNLQITDTFPLGVEYVDGSATAQIGGVAQAFTATATNRTLTLTGLTLPVGQQLIITYAATVSPDAVRGNGINTAAASDPVLGTASDTFQLTVRPGILSDCGTIVGRVFADANFDGHQQRGEPGIANAVIYMDSGNRIITDPNGLFSMANVISGNRVGALDLSSLNGYTLAPNLFRVEDNSQSRLVRLEPGGMARMNFAVTPTFGEGE